MTTGTALPQLVGRDPEHERLDALARCVARGESAALAVAGEPVS